MIKMCMPRKAREFIKDIIVFLSQKNHMEFEEVRRLIF